MTGTAQTYLDYGVSPIAVAMTFSICALLLLPFSIEGGYNWLAVTHNLWTMLFMGIMCTSLHICCF
ncbi:hypothetical protein ACIQXF_22285 [Lysinibacillus sp. NPDC097231]|uniref:hypothetical protein n=1 Tax=Lysinibacillus sp. NPDC097231 TaxID=3364142 RepID=UPI0037F44A2F